MIFDDSEEGYPEGEKPLHFFYNREERIKNAPKIVQDYYNGKIEFTRNPIKIMFKNKMNRFMFIFLILFSAFAYFMSYQAGKNALKIYGTSAQLTAFSYAEEVYVSLEIKPLSEEKIKDFKPVPVYVKILSYNNDSEVSDMYETEDVYDGSQLFLRTKFTDYDIIRVVADVTLGEENKSFGAKVIKR